MNHGMSKDPLYKRWKAIKVRCYYPRAINYEHYGGKGIFLHFKWLNDFPAFHAYVMALPDAMKPGMTLDRKNSDKYYGPGNLRWVDAHVQNANRGLGKNNKSGFKGVCFDKNWGKWKSDIRVHGKTIYLGGYEKIEDAVSARNGYIIKNKLTEYKPKFLLNDE